jgi:hypothetical protein
MVYAETSLSRIIKPPLSNERIEKFLMNIQENTDFILSHFESKLLFPRKMMTNKFNYQFTVYSKDQIIQKCIESDFIDCRINAYPEYTEYKGIVRQAPNFIFIDLDLANFEMDKKKLEFRLKRTLKKIEEYNGFPTVLWTGNGYHIYLPISATVLDQESIFSKDNFPNLFSVTGKYSNWSVSEVFLKYTEIFFTNGKADPYHKPKYKTCLIRIPITYNSKLLNKGHSKEESLVKVTQMWNGKRIPIQYLLKDFRRWLVQEELDQRIVNRKRKHNRPMVRLYNIYTWIEKLLQIPLEDHRKYCLRHIIVPYLVNVKDLPLAEVSCVIVDWMSKCNSVNPLSFDPLTEIKNRTRYVRDFKPMSLSKLERDNYDLYRLLSGRISQSLN